MSDRESLFTAHDRQLVEGHLRERSGPLADAVGNLLADHAAALERERVELDECSDPACPHHGNDPWTAVPEGEAL